MIPSARDHRRQWRSGHPRCRAFEAPVAPRSWGSRWHSKRPACRPLPCIRIPLRASRSRWLALPACRARGNASECAATGGRHPTGKVAGLYRRPRPRFPKSQFMQGVIEGLNRASRPRRRSGRTIVRALDAAPPRPRLGRRSPEGDCSSTISGPTSCRSPSRPRNASRRCSVARPARRIGGRQYPPDALP